MTTLDYLCCAFTIFAYMKRLLILLAVIGLTAGKANAYFDHRGHNVDSLERVVAPWTEDRWAEASEKQSEEIIYAYWSLMLGYRNINAERSMFFARKCYKLATRWNWLVKMADGLNGIAIIHYGRGQYDSSLFYYNQALEMTERMLRGETSFTMDKPYPEMDIDDTRSLLYGAIGNTYNLMDSIPKAMEYYKKAGEIFTKYGWNVSNAILWYNMGETWFEEGELEKALPCYETSLEYAQASGDSLQISSAYKGLGSYYLAKGKIGKAMKYIEEADSYYSLHQDQEFVARIETLGLTNKILQRQKKTWRLVALGGAIIIGLILALGLILRRNRKLSLEKAGADIVIEEALEEKPLDQELTDREREIVPLLAAGLTSQQIADKVCLSLATIKWYRKRLLEKFQASNSAELVSILKEKGLL